MNSKTRQCEKSRFATIVSPPSQWVETTAISPVAALVVLLQMPPLSYALLILVSIRETANIAILWTDHSPMTHVWIWCNTFTKFDYERFGRCLMAQMKGNDHAFSYLTSNISIILMLCSCEHVYSQLRHHECLGRAHLGAHACVHTAGVCVFEHWGSVSSYHVMMEQSFFQSYNMLSQRRSSN